MVTKAQIEEINELYNNGVSIEDIANMYRWTYNKVKFHVKLQPFTRAAKSSNHNLNKQELAELICKKLGIPFNEDLLKAGKYGLTVLANRL